MKKLARNNGPRIAPFYSLLTIAFAALLILPVTGNVTADDGGIVPTNVTPAMALTNGSNGLKTPAVPESLPEIPAVETGVDIRYRWVYFRDNIEAPAKLQKAKDVMLRAKNAGYNGFVLSNTGMEKLNTMTPAYRANVADLRDYAESLGLEFYPTVLTVGFANAMLSQDPNLIEGLPVKDALFVVRDGQATLVQDPVVGLPGGDFENVADNRFDGWDTQDSPGTRTFADSSVSHSGGSSLRGSTGGLSAYVTKNVTVALYRQYHLTFWVKTAGITSGRSLLPRIFAPDGRDMWNNDFSPAASQDWTRYDIVFNSMGYDRLTVKLGTWGTGGTFWIDDASLEEIGLTNVVRRSECPLVVKGEDGTVYTEGVDFQMVSDPRLGVVPYKGYYEPYHASPPIVLTDNSRIKEGQRLRVSFTHAINFLSGGTAISLTEPKAVDMFREQLTDVNNLVHPDGFFINYDEIRAGNWVDRDTPMTEGQLLATAFRREKTMANQVNPGGLVCVWGDMFDPSMNCKKYYYYCNGSVDGSYRGLSRDVVVVNWNGFGSRVNSLKFFTGRGNPQILAGYYDGSATNIKTWLADARANDAHVVGVMYTTWRYNYDQLETFARDAWGDT